jgi:recombination protein RecR
MNSIQKLTEYFSEFPGIGPRQARRFVYFLLTRNPEYLQQMTRLIIDLKKDIKICSYCFRFYQDQYTENSLCDICRNPNRDHSMLMIVSRDVDLENIEKTRSFAGLYFVLGGAVPILEKNPESRIRQRELLNTFKTRVDSGELKALNATAEGENTMDYIENILKPQALEQSIKISHLGRGISTGTEIEYSDSDTIKNALNNRK